MADKQKIKQDIIDAAKTLFTNNGFISTTISDISKACGYSRRTIYHHFDSKEMIMNHIIYQELQVLDKGIRELMEKEMDDKYYVLCDMIVNYIIFNPFSYEAVSKTKIYKISNIDQIQKQIFDIGNNINNNIYSIINNYYPIKMVSVYLLFQYLSAVCNLLSNNQKFILDSNNMNKNEFLRYSYDLFLRGMMNV
ncbi:MAG: TetR/AcrR family transcriptional regulator [Firmicutes bacterium]|nr:TetR/AcrR family transcriptional regulator [Erysipelotrichaceae bacterium]MDD6524643.1 TetR/AcrR family transcriptional regulator [Bacillota bacterium]MDD7228208.1 TetR/AcrR family transcriptional regulator [Bacillota bacterium]MDY5998039.1 TetR/AcrR family transcriptional regulator [Erysipelotrichaceae bacterium]